MRASRRAIAATLLALLAAACGEEDCNAACAAVACRPPFVLTVIDVTTGETVPGAVATSPGLACSAGPIPGEVSCDAGAAGTYGVTVSAPGYGAQQVSVAVEPAPPTGACECPRCPTWQPPSVALAPAG